MFSFCIISITLRNQGSDAYKNEEYGDSILIERRLTKDGTGSYKIKNQKSMVLFILYQSLKKFALELKLHPELL